MIVRDQILLDIERRNQRFLYLILVVFVIISGLFLLFIGRFDTNPFKLRQEIRSIVDLKLSSSDLLALFSEGSLDLWVDVRLIERDGDEYPIKIKRSLEYSFDFLINIDRTLYNLHRVGPEGKAMYDFFSHAPQWGLETTSPQLVQLKINNVFIGSYVMEEHIHEQIRDEKGAYFVRLGSDIILLRRIMQEVRFQLKLANPDTRLLDRWFDTRKMAAYFVFFSLFSYDRVLDFDRLMFRYDPVIKKFIPYLTLESVILSLNEQGRSFKPPPLDDSGFSRRLNRRNIDALLQRAAFYKYDALLKRVLTTARNDINGDRSH